MKQLPFKGILLICDMDGTLLNSKNEISRENRDALKYFVEGGGLFTIATGRTAKGVSRYLEELPVNVPAIVINGAQIFDFKSNRVLWRCCLENDVENTLLELIFHFPELGMEIFYDGGVCITRQNDITEEHRLREEIFPGTKEVGKVPKPWYKVVLAWENTRLKEVERFLHGKTGAARAVFSEETFLDLLNAKTSKGHALKELMVIIDGSHLRVVALGDNLNDMEMIKAADIGVAVGNAHEDLKKCAAFCSCHHDHHAVAHTVYNMIDNF